MRGFTKSGIADEIRRAGGEIYAVTSEPNTLARNAQDDWDTGLLHVGDPHHEIANECRDHGWLSLFKAEWDTAGLTPTAAWHSHPNGFFQPGVLVVDRESRVLYRWRSRPTRSNLGSAQARPKPEHVWQSLQSAQSEGVGAPDAAYDENAVLDAPPAPWPLFVMLLVANGWFWYPRTFDHAGGEFTADKRIRGAFIRLFIFTLGWIAAAVLLPTWIVGLAFAAWVAKILPGIINVHRVFQNVAPDEEPS